MKRGVLLLIIVAIGVLLVISCSPKKPSEDKAKEKTTLGGVKTGLPAGGTNPTGGYQPHCGDGVKNGAETDVDCGGDCGKCALGLSCSAGSDCVSTNCVTGKCRNAA